jgi:flagellar FliL protein
MPFMAEDEDLPEEDPDDSRSDRNDPDDGDEDAEGEEGGGGKKKLIIMVAALLLLLVGVGAGLYFTGVLDGLLGKDAESGEHTEDGHGDKKKDSHGSGHGEGGAQAGFVAVPTIVVNLNTDDDDVPRYLRLTVQLELEDPSMKENVEAILPRVVDQFQTYLRELHVQDLKGSAGIYRLQMELLWRVNEAAAPAEVKDILFQEILIQ